MASTIRKISVAVAAFSLAAAAPVAAQTLSPELQALDDALPGTLVNDPSKIDWESYGPDFYTEGFRDNKVPGGAARRFHVNSAARFIYESGANIPIIRRIPKGEDVTIGFYARTVEAATDDGKGILRVRFQENVAPFSGYGDQTLKIGNEWGWYEVTAKADQSLRTRTGIVAIHFGDTKQILEIGQAIIVTGSNYIANAPTPSAPEAPQPAAPVNSELPEPLRGFGDLMNDPTDRDWTVAAEGGTADSRDDATIWLGQTTRIATSTTEQGQIAAMIDVPGDIKEGQEILVALAAKTVASQRPGGAASLGVGLWVAGEEEPLKLTTVSLGTDWQLVRFKTKAPKPLADGTARIALLADGIGEAIDVGPVYVFDPAGAAAE